MRRSGEFIAVSGPSIRSEEMKKIIREIVESSKGSIGITPNEFNNRMRGISTDIDEYLNK